uniref:Neuralized n=1 Tax=Globodera rostochiensis TaxID=31243 RepID=A0A914H0S4_GLORO
MGNSAATARSAGDPQSTLTPGEAFSDYNENIINRGTLGRPKPLLKFHSVCGTNIQLLREGNRPISIDEIVCIRLSEVGTNWSGVMRFGVTNVDPASFRDIELPKFACPDLTSKGGYWAKSLAERYSVEGSILHFFTNESGEIGINVINPLWIIVDIYGNSIAVEFIDPNEVQLQSKRISSKNRTGTTLSARNASQPLSSESAESSPAPMSLSTYHQSIASMTASNSANNLLNVTANSPRSSSSRASPMANASKKRFHNVKGVNVYLQHDETVAVRKHGEYYQGYVFTERPINVGDKLVILVSQVEDAFSGSLAFGLTSCDPIKVPASRLPVDSDELLERPEYWVCIKDVAAMPQVGDKLSFQVDAGGRVIFSKNDAPSRVIMHVDTSIPLWAFFDLYGSTRKIQLLDIDTSLSTRNIADLSRSYRASSEGACVNVCADRSSVVVDIKPRPNRPSSTNWNTDSLRVALPVGSSSTHHGHSSAIAIQSESAVLSNASISAGPSGAGATSSSAPSSTTPPFSSHPMESTELAQIRANIAMRRRNRADASNGGVGGQTSTLSSAFLPDTSQPNTSNSNSSGIAANGDSVLNRSPPTLNELLASRRIQLEARMAALAAIRDNQSPIRDDVSTDSSPAGRNEAAESAQQQNKSPVGRNEAAESAQQQNTANGEEQPGNECSICMSNQVNAVIYRCGHMCMCFSCAKETHRRSGDCPICRTPIIDVIRCYPV